MGLASAFLFTDGSFQHTSPSPTVLFCSSLISPVGAFSQIISRGRSHVPTMVIIEQVDMVSAILSLLAEFPANDQLVEVAARCIGLVATIASCSLKKKTTTTTTSATATATSTATTTTTTTTTAAAATTTTSVTRGTDHEAIRAARVLLLSPRLSNSLPPGLRSARAVYGKRFAGANDGVGGAGAAEGANGGGDIGNGSDVTSPTIRRLRAEQQMQRQQKHKQSSSLGGHAAAVAARDGGEKSKPAAAAAAAVTTTTTLRHACEAALSGLVGAAVTYHQVDHPHDPEVKLSVRAREHDASGGGGHGACVWFASVVVAQHAAWVVLRLRPNVSWIGCAATCLCCSRCTNSCG
jgi:hypothetical protein